MKEAGQNVAGITAGPPAGGKSPPGPGAGPGAPARPCLLRALALLWLLAAACASGPAPGPEPPAVAAPARFRIATFNIQVFGQKKAGRPRVMAQLASIITRYDLVAVQEVRDRHERVCDQLLVQVRALDPDYDYVLSPRSGLQPDDRSSQEQYAYFFRRSRLRVVGEPHLYDDSRHDYFQREPFISRFILDAGRFSFVLINIHTRPRSALQEIAALEHVIAWSRRRFVGERHFIALGDFNAGCGYASEADLSALPIHGEGYSWVVPHSADTNLADSQCPYDRIVVASPRGHALVKDWGVDRAFSDRQISDHWPVWAEFLVP